MFYSWYRNELTYHHSKLNHKNILSFLGAALETTSFLITEYMDRGNLSDVLTAHPNISLKLKVQMALDAAQGIFYLHSQNPIIVHRDLKSLNLLVCTLVLCDDFIDRLIE